MKAAVVFEASTRESTGKGASRALRREGKIPAIVYGEGKENVSVALDANSVTQEYLRGGLMSKIVEIKAGKGSIMALPKEMQFNPVTDRIEHADFYQVDEKSTIHVMVPVHFLNQEKSIGLKRGGVLNVVRHDLELVCSVSKIPSFIEIDLLTVDIGHSIHISHVTLPEGVKPAITSRDFTIATIAGRGGKQDVEDDGAPSIAADAVPADKAKAPAEAAKKDAKK
jgi:large subunit ribosomal protein L25